MKNDRTRHVVEARLADEGWAVYRQAIGGEGYPALVAARGLSTVLVAVAAAIENGRGVYPAWGRAEGAHVLASVAGDGAVTYCDAERRFQAPTLAEAMNHTTDARVVALAPSAGRYGGLTPAFGV